jgi:transposase
MAERKTSPLITIPPEIEAEMTPAVKAFVIAAFATFEARIAILEKQVKQLTAQLAGNSPKATPNNSSVPSSTVHPHNDKDKPGRKKPKSKLNRGGQKGHKKHSRELVPPERCDKIVDCHPDACRRCGGTLVVDTGAPQRHQVWEIPPIEPIISEYRLHRGNCPCCGISTQATLPAGVPAGQCGPRLAAFTGLLMGHFRQSKRKAASFLGDLLNVPCSASWTVKIQNQVSEAIAEPYEELRQQLCQQKQLFVDESPTKQGKTKAWLWVAVAPLSTVFGIFLNRKRESLKSFIGDYSGVILNCDRAKMYFDGKIVQWCWAHLKRDIQKLIDHDDGQVKRLGRDLMRQQKLLFENWRRYKAGKIKWETFQILVRPIRNEFNSLLVRGSFSGNAKLIGFCDELRRHQDWLWTFTKIAGIEPTNNDAERALRPAVIYRKLSFGTQSERGSRYLERILTVSETCRRQSRSAYEFLVSAMEAKYANQPAPSLHRPIAVGISAA